MQKVLTAAQLREVDRLTTERYGIPSIILMENAAHAVARVITEKLGGSVKGKSILILCGKGNNGGDGAALARILGTQGAEVNAILLGTVADTKGDARVNFDALQRLGVQDMQVAHLGWYSEESLGTVSFSECENLETWQSDKVGEVRGRADVYVDAILGTGVNKPLSGIYSDVANSIAWELDDRTDRKPMVVSVDLPSGLNADLATPIGNNARADFTVTFTAPKPANVLPGVSHFNGELVVADIGSPAQLLDELERELQVTQKDDLTSWLWDSRFSDDSYKNKRGHALLIAGSENYSGAAVLAGNAAMRSGVGLVTLAAPKECKAEIASRLLPDVILTAIDTDEPELLTKADAIAVGCGLDANDPGIEKLVRKVVSTRDVPVVVDAGALWFFNPPSGIPSTGDGQPPLIFTPHEGEFLRLLGTDDKDAIKDRVAAVREFSQKHNVILVLKGERVLIGEPGGKVVVNPTGNSGLGKAGNGDTLTGIVTGFVAQAAKMNIDIFETVVAAVYVAGLAGDIAEKKYGKRVMTASDVRECLVEVFSQIEDQKTANGC